MPQLTNAELASNLYPYFYKRGEDVFVSSITRSVIAGDGLTGGGSLAADVTLNVATATTSGIAITADAIAVKIKASAGLAADTDGLYVAQQSPSGLSIDGTGIAIADSIAGAGLDIAAKVLALGTPTTLTVATTNAVTASSHTHAITSTKGLDPSGSSVILSTDAGGYVWVDGLGVGVSAAAPLHVLYGGLEQVRIGYDATHYASLEVSSGSNITVHPLGDIYLNPVTTFVFPTNKYEVNLGSLSQKYLTLHCAELWVETLVAQETIATIGGRILVGPTTTLTQDFDIGDILMYVKHNQMDYNDTVYMEANGKVEFMRVQRWLVTGVDISLDTFTFAGNQTARMFTGRKLAIRGSTGNDGTWTIVDSTYTTETVVEVVENVTNATADGYAAYLVETTGPELEYIYLFWASARNLDSSGENDWFAGDAVFNTGYDDDGFMDLYSYSGVTSGTVGPTIVGNIRKSNAYNDWSEHWAIGNLGGLYGRSAGTYGVGFGQYNAGTGFNYMTVTDTNGIEFFDNAGIRTAQLTGEAWTIGEVSASHNNVHITGDAVQFRVNEVVYGSLTTSTWTIGQVDTALENITIQSGGIRFRLNETTIGIMTGTAWRLGQSSAPNVYITTSAFQLMDNTVVKMDAQTDGDLFIGSNVASVATTYFSLFATAQGSYEAGDLVIGSYDTGDPNMFWDVNGGVGGTGQLGFRSGVADPMVWINTSGQVVAGGGDVKMDDAGVSIFGASDQLAWYSGTDQEAYIGRITDEEGTSLRLFRGTAAGSNLIANGDFETDVTGWTANAEMSIVRSGAQSKLGSYSGYIECNADIGAGWVFTTSYMTVSGNAAQFSSWIYITDVFGWVTMDIDWYNSSSVLVSTSNITLYTGEMDTWVYHEVVASKPATAVKAKAGWTSGGGSPVQLYAFYVDDVKFFDVTTNTTYIDLLSENASPWSSTITMKASAIRVWGDMVIGDGIMPNAKLTVLDTSVPQMNLMYSGSYYTTFETTSSGQLTITPTASLVRISGTSPTLRLSTGTSTFDLGEVAGVLRLSGSANTGVSILHGLRVGDTTAPTDNDIYATGDIVAAVNINAVGGLRVGDATAPTNDDIRATADIVAGGGVYAGGVGGDPATGTVYATTILAVGDAVDAKVTQGLIVDMGTSTTTHAISLKAAGVTHGILDHAETDTFGFIGQVTDNLGGLNIFSLGEGTVGIWLQGGVTTEITTKTTSSVGTVVLRGHRKSGSALIALTNTAGGTAGNVVAIRNSSRTLAIFAGDGDLYLDTSLNSTYWDDYDDLALLHGFRASTVDLESELRKRFGKFIGYARPILEAEGIVVYNDGPGGDGVPFVAMKKLQMLTIDAVRQFYDSQAKINETVSDKLARYERQLASYEQALLAAGLNPAQLAP